MPRRAAFTPHQEPRDTMMPGTWYAGPAMDNCMEVPRATPSDPGIPPASQYDRHALQSQCVSSKGARGLHGPARAPFAEAVARVAEEKSSHPPRSVSSPHVLQATKPHGAAGCTQCTEAASRQRRSRGRRRRAHVRHVDVAPSWPPTGTPTPHSVQRAPEGCREFDRLLQHLPQTQVDPGRPCAANPASEQSPHATRTRGRSAQPPQRPRPAPGCLSAKRCSMSSVHRRRPERLLRLPADVPARPSM
mmetsp:Transcript_87687/g.277204  ORF Transcript_87687/g.277204 Transcript_87687/m.277204 type:complete len:247 (+) Transcript_87687:1101-1841(+)